MRAVRTLWRSISSRFHGRSSIAFGIVAEQPFGGVGDVEPSVSRAVIAGAAIRSLAKNFNRANAMPSHELAGDMLNKIVVVHDCQNSGLRCSLLPLAAETWLIGRMSPEFYSLIRFEHKVDT
jgi:hypothetical protein